MHYILDNNGYVELCSKTHVECDDRGCTEYTGTIPSGYKSIEEWVANANIRAYKVVDGNLVYDPERDADLQKEYEREAEDNTLATHRWVKDKINTSSSVVTDEFSSEKIGNSLIVLDDTGNYEIPYLKVESASASNVNVISSNKNILGVETLSNTINGVRFDVNTDGTITLNGTATDNIEFTINGSSTNTEMLFLMNKDIDYAISGLANNVSLSLYSFDGTNRTLVNKSFNDVVKLSSSYLITQATLNIESEASFNGVVISPQVEVNNGSTSFVKHEETKSSGKLINNGCVIEDLMSYEGNTIIMIDEEVTSNIKYYTHQFLNEKFAEIEVREGKITSTVSEMNETIEGQNQKISQVTQSVDEINSKITDIADITTSAESNYASVNLVNVNESEPMTIKIHPINEDVSFLYPRNNLYPSDDLYLKGRTIRFTNTKTKESFDYELPADLLYYDANTYDEFNLSYDSKTCSVTKRVGYVDANGNKGTVTEKTTNYEFPTIPLTAGDYKVSLLGYSGVYLFVQLMAANLYTTQFATKVELSSSIEQTKDSITSEVKAEYATKDEVKTSVSTIKQTTDSINLEVAKKVDNKDYTSAQILMKINNDTSSTLIKSDKLDVDAIATFTNSKLAKAGSTTINGANITTGTLDASKVSVINLNANNIKSGTISTARLSSDVITTSNFSAQTVNANKINGGTVSSSDIDLYNGTGFLKMSVGDTYHPYVSALNVATQGASSNLGGISFRNGTGRYGRGNENARIACTGNGNLYTISNGTANYSSSGATGIDSGSYMRISSGNSEAAGTYSGSTYITADASITLAAKNGAVYAAGNGLESKRVMTTEGGASSRNTKENFAEFDNKKYEKSLKLLKDMNLYEYDYKYDLYKDKHQYGFIIDEIEELDKEQEFFKIHEEEAIVNGKYLNFNTEEKKDTDEVIQVKMYDSNTLDKYLLTVCKALLNKVENLENRIKELESDK